MPSDSLLSGTPLVCNRRLRTSFSRSPRFVDTIRLLFDAAQSPDLHSLKSGNKSLKRTKSTVPLGGPLYGRSASREKRNTRFQRFPCNLGFCAILFGRSLTAFCRSAGLPRYFRLSNAHITQQPLNGSMRFATGAELYFTFGQIGNYRSFFFCCLAKRRA